MLIEELTADSGDDDDAAKVMLVEAEVGEEDLSLLLPFKTELN